MSMVAGTLSAVSRTLRLAGVLLAAGCAQPSPHPVGPARGATLRPATTAHAAAEPPAAPETQPEPIGDADGDGLSDREDGCPEQAELVNGIDDLDGCPDPGKSLIMLHDDRIELLEKVHFRSQKSPTLDPKSFAVLNQVAMQLRLRRDLEVRVEAHHDDRHVDEFGLRLSQAQAQSVARYLIQQGVDPRRIETRGIGSERPIASNATAAGRERNWRIEIWLRRAHGQSSTGARAHRPEPTASADRDDSCDQAARTSDRFDRCGPLWVEAR